MNSSQEGESLVQKTVNAVRAYIQNQELKVGDVLPGEGHFARNLGVSRAVIREAFGALAALNFIKVANGRRARVSAMDGSVIASSLSHAVIIKQISVAEIWDVRRTVEIRIAALSAEKRTDSEARKICELANAMREAASDFNRMTQYDISFHEAIAKSSRNALFNSIVQSFAPMMGTAIPQAWNTPPAIAQRNLMIEKHIKVAEAILAQDPIAASKAMDDHFDASVGAVLKNQSFSQT